MMRIFLLLGFLLSVLSPSAAQAQSFDCHKARTADERMICQVPLLSELDEIMALFYKRLRRYTAKFDNAMGPQERLKREARDFLERRAACGGDVSCIEGVYRERIRELLRHWDVLMEEIILSESPQDEGHAGRPAAPAARALCRALGLERTRRHRRLCPQPLQYPEMVEGWALGEGRVACAMPCSVGAYNAGYLAWLVDAATGRVLRPLRFPTASRRGTLRQMDEVVSPTYDAATRTLRAFHRGRGLGDCGEKHRWRWNGDAFRLVAQQVKDSCDGNPRHGWRQLWPR